jgi:hypothetical protein
MAQQRGTSGPRRNAELAKVLGFAEPGFAKYAEQGDLQAFNEAIKINKKLFESEKERLRNLEKMRKELIAYNADNTEAFKLVDKQYKETKKLAELEEKREEQQKKLNNEAKKYADILKKEASKALDIVLKQNEDIFKVAKEFQLESNLTWKQYTQVYNQAFEATRKINKETGQAISNAKDLIETQNKLLGAGFRGINLGDLGNLSASVSLIQRTLGQFPEELAVAFRQSYRVFGSQTDRFVTNIGNRLNAFSNTFGVSINMLTGVVSEMMTSNSFLFRNNMQAQTSANENLMRAAALSGMVGLTSSNFISNLASTTQFGTIEEMSSLYQGGALLQGFDTGQFQQMMQGGNYQNATEMLFGSISQTLGGMQDQYLRAEYMQQIGGAFGLSREDLLLITQNAENLGEYSAELEQKVRGIDTSMVDELGELKMAVVDRLDNWWTSTGVSQGFGKVMQDLGLVGAEGYLKQMTSTLYVIAAQGGLKSLGGKIGSMFGGAGSAGGGLGINMSNFSLDGVAGGGSVGSAGLSGMARLGIGAGGLAVGIGGNVLGRSIQSNTNLSDTAANLGGGAVNVLSGAAGGAMIGSIIPGIGTLVGAGIGAGIGAIAGGINTYLGAKERESAMQQIEDEKRSANARRRQPVAQTGDPLIDAIERQTAVLENAFTSGFQESIKFQYIADTQTKTSTLGD